MKKAPSGAFFISREADAEHGQPAYTCPLLAQHGPLFCPLERRGPRSTKRWQYSRAMYDSGRLDTKRPGKIRALCMIPRPSTQKCRLPGNIRTLCIRNRPIAPRNGYMGRRSCQLQREKHAFRANVAREAPLFAQSAKRGYMTRESCHISQNNLINTTKQ